MIDPKEHLHASAPVKGTACVACGVAFDAKPSLVLQIRILLKSVNQRICLDCARHVREVVDLRIAQAERGDFSK